ncbi:MAG TPA: class I SAM-dependent methyltransferase [Methylomirabilota bacterium]|nr:class I SAM-dependent methyltransferase [Methylomirabilota bacterium]
MMAAVMAGEPQNVYDDPEFFAGYSRLERFGAGWERASEHADLMGLLPDVAGRRVLDLGCGAGQLAHHLATRGAAGVVGLDVSERMLALARTRWAHARVTYQRTALEAADFPPSSFDLVVSVLVLHYVEDYRGLIARVAGWLAPGGVLVYSTEHPLYTGRLPGEGWVRDAAGTRWAVDRYADEGPRDEHWFVPGVRKVHRTLATLVNGVVDAGLVVERVLEPVPGEAWLEAHPQMRDERRRPMFLILRARKPQRTA